MTAQVPVLKDEEKAQLVPTVWRRTLVEVVNAFAAGDHQLKREVAGVEPIREKDAERIAKNIAGYGARLTNLPEDTWQTSVCQWMCGYWDVLIDVFTVEEGPSDLVLFVRIYEHDSAYRFEVQSIHVP